MSTLTLILYLCNTGEIQLSLYYKLEEKFLSRAGITPGITSNELFGNQEDGFDVEGLDEEDEAT